MLDQEARKRLIDDYKKRSRRDRGGVYLIRNTRNGKVLVEIASDIEAAENRFSFSQKTGSCINMKINKDWSVYGPDTFTFETAETIDKNENQTPMEFREDLNVLKKLWLEKFEAETLY
jgi:hypothetical protein